ncbi:hypothetical protein [Actinoplanes couchii]|uniref:Lipoprotein n=1 Tax=Actinoplanes couchii TaxID=403638 RepID=A0ABQ3XNA9_9ACTN|nr:hypothetical protein [Actinoplanes couchii]MDR6318085.1 hypothetical protein [Actinoplanes couchii]GID59999.1 hypothetical protein Aco03nite_084030 [Actinoplanes couchii]
MRVTATLTALAGLTLSMQACTGASEAVTPTPVAATVAGPEDIFTGERKALIHIAEDDKDWSATYEGPIAIGDGTDDGALFRLVPAAGDQYLIEALRPREEGGRWCATADTRDEPTSIATGACTENANTLFSITATGEQDDKGRPTHRITSEEHGTLQVKNDGSALYLQQVGDGGSRGTYSFVDRGPIE